MIFERFVCFFVIISAFTEAVVHQANRFTCPKILIRNGKIRNRSRGRFVKFICNQGYSLAGERHSTCLRGKWDPPPPKCVRATCTNKPPRPVNGNIYPSHNGAALHYFCLPGFSLRGHPDVYCDGKIWDNNPPICIETGEKPKLFCDFETEDICGWTHDLNHDFDWRRMQNSTPTGAIGTGPSFDHTLGFGKAGYYMYIESSSRNENDTARLISPVYDAVYEEVCFEFFYHMFGKSIGSLRVYVKKESDSWNLDPERAIFSKSGNQGDKWYRSFIRLGLMEEDYQIIIEGVRGSSYVSDIAIDDVKIIVNCTEEPVVTSTSELPLTEVFPTIDSCENRCGLTEGISNDSYHLTCDCDDDCYENNRCCPDFFDFCVTATTTPENDATTDLSNEIAIDRFSPPFLKPTFNKTEKIISTTPKQPNFSSKANETVPTKSSSTAINTWTTQTTSKGMNSDISQAKSSTTSSTKAVTVQNTPTTLRTTKKITLPTLYIKTNPSTPKIIRFTNPDNKKTPPTIPTRKPTTRKIILTPSTRKTRPPTTPPTTPKLIKATTSKIKAKTPPYKYPPKIYFITTPTTRKIVRKTTSSTIRPVVRSTKRTLPYKPFNPKESEDNDFLDVTIPKNNDETLLITTAPEKNISNSYSSEEEEEKLEFVNRKNFSETLKLLTEKEADTDTNNVMAIVVSAIGTVVFIIIVAILLMKYYRSPRRRALFSGSVSQSDVRFFPNDENLDFSLDNDLYGKT